MGQAVCFFALVPQPDCLVVQEKDRRQDRLPHFLRHRESDHRGAGAYRDELLPVQYVRDRRRENRRTGLEMPEDIPRFAVEGDQV